MIEAELPDGTVLEFPDGTSPDVIKNAVKRRLSAAAPAGVPAPQAPPSEAVATPSDASEKPFQRSSGMGPTLSGVGDAAIKAYLGLKSFLPGGLDKYEQGALNEMKMESEADPEGGWRTAGEIGGNIAMTAIPGAAASKALPLTMLGKAAPIANAAAVSGATDFLITPGDLEEKVKAGGQAAAMGAGFAAGGKLLKKALTKPFTPTKEAEQLMAEGVYPTLRQGAASRTGRALGSLTEGVLDNSQRQNKEVSEAFLKRVAPGADLGDMRPHEQVGVLRDRFAHEYDEVFDGKTFTLGSSDKAAVKNALRGDGSQHAEALKKAKNVYAGTFPRTLAPTRDMSPEKMQMYSNVLQDRIEEIAGKDTISGQARALLTEARKIYNDGVRKQGLSPDELARLADIDERMNDFMRFQHAAGKVAPHQQGVVRAPDLLQSYKDMGEGVDFATATNKTQRELLIPATETLGLGSPTNETTALSNSLRRLRQFGSVLGAGGGAAASAAISPALVAPWAVSLAGQTKPGARALFGDYNSQKALAEGLRKIGPYLAGSGAAVPQE